MEKCKARKTNSSPPKPASAALPVNRIRLVSHIAAIKKFSFADFKSSLHNHRPPKKKNLSNKSRRARAALLQLVDLSEKFPSQRRDEEANYRANDLQSDTKREQEADKRLSHTASGCLQSRASATAAVTVMSCFLSFWQRRVSRTTSHIKSSTRAIPKSIFERTDEFGSGKGEDKEEAIFQKTKIKAM